MSDAGFTRISEPKLLIGEGKEEVRFFRKFIETLKVTDIQVEQYGGKNRLGDFLRALTKAPGFDELESLGVTRDADDTPKDALKSVKNALKAAGFHAGNGRKSKNAHHTSVEIHLFPSGTDPGMLETVCLQSVTDDPAMTCVDSFFKCVEENVSDPPRNESKARVHAWLSSRKRPDLRLGEAAEKGYWPLDHEAFDSFREFVRAL